MSKLWLIFICIILVFFPNDAHGKELYFRSLGIKDGLSQPSAISIWQDPFGRMWFGNDAINCFDGKNTKVIHFSQYFPSLEDSNIHALCGNKSTVFLLAEKQVVFVDLLTGHPTLTDLTATHICVYNNELYLAENHSIYKYDQKSGVKKELFTDSKLKIRQLTAINANEFWIGTTSGLFKIDLSKRKIVNAVCKDKDIFTQYLDSNHQLWFGTTKQQSGVVSPKGEVRNIMLNNKTFASDIHCFTEDKNGNVWIGTITGIYKANCQPDSSPKILTKEPLMAESPITALLVDRQGTLWIGPYYGDIRYINMDVDNLTYYRCDENVENRLHGVVIGSMVEDNENNLYVASEGSGVNILQNNSIRHITTQTYPLPNNKIRALWFDNQFNRLFISTYREKLIYLDKKTNALKNIDSPLLNNMHQSTIENMIPYQEDMLVLLSQDGLLKMNRQTLAIDYLLDDSLLRQKCTGNIRSIYIDDKNRLWVSSLEEGLILIDLNTQKLLHRYGNGLQKDSKIPSAINAICGNSKNGLFMSTLNSGILQYNNEKNTFESYAKEKHLLMSNICYNIVMSNFGNLIVTTDKGVSIIDVSVNKKAASAYHIHLNDLHQISGLGTDCGIYVSPYNNRIYVGALYGLFSFNEHDINQQTDNYSLLFSTLTVNNQTISPNTSELLSKEISFTKQITLPYNQNTLSLTFTTTNYVLSNYTTYEYKMEGLDKIWISAKDKTITYSSLRPGTYKLTVREVENPQKATTLEVHIQPPFWFAWQAWILYGILLFFATRWLYRFNKTKTRLRTSLRTEQEKIDFLTNISNELRGPLTVIITLLNTLSAEQNTIGKGRIGKVVKQALYMQHLITQLLTFNDTEKEELSLPDEKESDENEGTAETDESTSPYTLIIIDQNEDIRNIIKETFSFAYRIVEARNGDEGYALATTEHPDIIFCEITVPGISGIELCKMLKSNIETLSIPILLITSNPSNEQKLLCIRAGADDYIVKPFQMELLLQRSNSLIRNRRNIEGKYSAEIVEQPSDLMAKNNSEQMFLDAAARVIEKNLDNTAFDISLWSKELEVGRTTLFNQIKEITGMTPNDYILSYKMNKAKLLLHDNNNQPIAEIAYRLGYSDPAYFSRSFKKIVGVSPQLYKKSNNNFHSKEADSPTP